MIATDANFDSLAEVHVPAYCATPTDYMVGCPFAGATNYDPTAKQSGECFYHTTGCMTQNSVNHNPRDHGRLLVHRDGSRLPRQPRAVRWQDHWHRPHPVGFAASLTNMGIRPNPTGPAVTNYVAGANYNTGCTVAIEGCMDSTARNYDAAANVQTVTWCVSRRCRAAWARMASPPTTRP